MNLYPLSIALLFLSFVLTFTAGGSNNNPSPFTGDVSINCGSIGTSAASNGREWIGDVQPKLSSLLQIQGSSTTSTVIYKLKSSADPIPHKTARISHSQFSYAFQLNPGQKIIRLHFNPSTYRGFKGFRDLFTVEAGPFTLLSNFSASLTADALGVNSISKEFCLNIHENQQFNLTFSPETSQLLDTYAFINGIEIISVPASLSYFRGGDIGVQVVGQKSLVYVDYETALEIIHRLDAKQHSVPSTGNFDDMFPKWAMQKAYKRKNNTWKIAVDVGFRYLIRIHFSEIGLKIVGTGGDVMFKVLINGMIAQTNIDMVKERDENNIPWYRDYMVMMRGHKTEGKRDLLISLQSYDDLIDGHALLAGFEILKLSNPDNSLASLNPMPPARDSPSRTIILISVLGYRNVIATVAITVISLVNIIVHKFREYGEANSTKEENKPSARAERLCRHFSLVEIQIATKNFSDALLIGRGGFGKVYKGHIDKGQMTVAVKRLKLNSNQGAHEFLMEIETLSELRHVNLVSLIGYCNERGEMILVYDYMAGGTLADQLYKIPRESNECSSLTWKQRLNICIGAGRGLDYLHTGHGIIHRDVKASNILLDENFVAKVSDFGLAKIEDRSKLESHVSTKVKGTRGYLDPHYFNTCKITRKSDTYAFGVVLFEVLCGRPAVDSWLPEDERILANWGRVKSSKGEVDQIVDSSLREEISPDSLKTFVGVAERCLHDEPKNRPTMSQVVLQLEFALEQQDSKQVLVLNEITSAKDDIHRNSNDENDQSVKTDGQNATPPPKDQTDSIPVNTELPFGRNTMYKPSRLWPWDAFWNRVKLSKKNELATNVRNEVIIFTDIGVPLTFENVVRATGSFHSRNCIGNGGFGATYKAEIAPGVLVAIKRLAVGRFQGVQQFHSEIKTLGRLSLPNLVTLIGYHASETEMFLIYNYLPGGNLGTFLQERSTRGVDWRVIHKIALDISRALAYLHDKCVPRVIHRDVKPSHILLDENHNACLSGFGLARLLGTSETHATTGVAGTFGYVAPEYAMTCRVSDKADVYSYGVVLLELLSDKKALDPSFSSFGNGFNIVTWACMLLREGRAKDFFMAGLWDAGPHDDLVEVLHLAVVCTADSFSDRPAMKQVVRRLNQLQPASC